MSDDFDDDDQPRGPATPDNTRKPGTSGLPITLEDGRSWHFAAPGLRRRPKVNKAIVSVNGRDEVETAIEGETVWGISLDLRNRLEAVTTACDSDPSGDCPTGLIFGLAFASLRTCHDLTPDEACDVLDMSDDDFQRFAPRVVLIAMGHDPDAVPVPASTVS